MIREIMKDEVFLSKKSESATKEDMPVAVDLMDTLKAHAHHCVGLAANMIGEQKRIIAVYDGLLRNPLHITDSKSLRSQESVIKDGNAYLAMLNPEIVKKSAKTYKTSEGCLSLAGERDTVRHDWIEVKYRDMDFRKQKQKFTGFTAQIIQHEIDHCEGILI